jgi:hypothetical protein
MFHVEQKRQQMDKMTRKEFVELCGVAKHPICRLADLPADTRSACVERARNTASRKGKFLHEILPFVMHIRGTSGKVELTVLIEKENEIV